MRKVTIKGLLAHKLRLALTSLAIVLGVTFISGTFVLTDTLHNMFFSLVGNIYQKIDFEVRGVAQFPGNGAGRRAQPVPERSLATVRARPGRRGRLRGVEGYAQFLSRTGKPIATGAEPTLGENFDPDPRTSELRIVQGGPPTTSHDVVMDAGTAKKYHFSVGQRVRILFGGAARTFTITGIVQFGTADNLAGVTLAAFTLPTAQAVLGEVGQFDHINVVAGPGRRQGGGRSGPSPGPCRPGPRSSPARPWSTSRRAPSTRRCRFSPPHCWCSPSSRCSSAPSPSSTRSRSPSGSGPGSWRCCGSSAPAAARCSARCSARPPSSGCVSSLVGIGLGVLAAIGLEALLSAFGFTLPSGPLVFEARTVVVALIVGVGVTVVSAISPARRAVRIPPIAAIADRQGGGEVSARRRFTRGAAVALVGAALLARRAFGAGGRPGGRRGRGRLRRCRHAGPGRGPAALQRHRAALGRRPRGARQVGPGELHAQPPAYGPDGLGPHDRHRPGVGHGRVRGVGVALGYDQRRRRHQRRPDHHRDGQRLRVVQHGRWPTP